MNPLHLRSAGTSLVISFDSGEAEVIHWGADLGSMLPDLAILTAAIPPSSVDAAVPAGLLPQASSSWRGRPALRGHRLADGVSGLDFSARLRTVTASSEGNSAVIVQSDPDAGLTVSSALTLHDGGLLELRHTLTNDGTTPYQLDELATVLPVAPDAVELLDLTGRWCRERHPQRRTIQQGTWVRTGRHGRTGHDSSLLFAAGTAGFGNRHGQVWATHLAWSGNHEQFADSIGDGRTMIGGSELLGPAEVILAPGGSYTTPALFAAYSARGLDGISEAFYSWFRSRPHHVLPAAATGLPAGKPRPVVLNVWEAVYFDHNLDTLMDLAESAADLGVERFVLDDGWFRGRRDDHAGLGDWYVDETLWPNGLTPLIDAVTSRGMEFGLWVEPEMVNLDSDIVRAHPEWIAGPSAQSYKDGGRLPLEWRHQHILDLVNPDAWQYIYDRVDALLRENDISYLKWDQNRDLLEHGHAGRSSVHEQTLAAYRLFDELRKAHPGVEIESCSSGGARVDLGILERTDRIWGSDCNDALERQTIQRWTGVVVPPELVGGHIGPTTSHTTARTHDLSFRAITALFGHFGMEWDVRGVQGAEREELKRFIGLYKEHRGLIHSGRMIRADVADDSLMLHGVVADGGADMGEGSTAALFALVSTRTAFSEQPGRIAVPGLDPERDYRVKAIFPAPADADYAHTFTQVQPPAWLADGAVASGRFLAEVGLPMPALNPEHALLLKIIATPPAMPARTPGTDGTEVAVTSLGSQTAGAPEAPSVQSLHASGIRDVATAAGVSTATVSRALRGLPRVSQLTRQRIVAAAASPGYVPSSAASELARRRGIHAAGVVEQLNQTVHIPAPSQGTIIVINELLTGPCQHQEPREPAMSEMEQLVQSAASAHGFSARVKSCNPADMLETVRSVPASAVGINSRAQGQAHRGHPGLDLPMEMLLFGESDMAPACDRIDTAKRQLLQFTLCARAGSDIPLSCGNTGRVGGARSHTPRSEPLARRPFIRCCCPSGRHDRRHQSVSRAGHVRKPRRGA